MQYKVIFSTHHTEAHNINIIYPTHISTVCLSLCGDVALCCVRQTSSHVTLHIFVEAAAKLFIPEFSFQVSFNKCSSYTSKQHTMTNSVNHSTTLPPAITFQTHHLQFKQMILR